MIYFSTLKTTWFWIKDLVGKRAVHLPEEVVHLVSSTLVHGGAHGPDETEDEPQLDHVGVVLRL